MHATRLLDSRIIQLPALFQKHKNENEIKILFCYYTYILSFSKYHFRKYDSNSYICVKFCFSYLSKTKVRTWVCNSIWWTSHIIILYNMAMSKVLIQSDMIYFATNDNFTSMKWLGGVITYKSSIIEHWDKIAKRIHAKIPSVLNERLIIVII